MPIRQRTNALLFDLKNTHNLRRRLYANMAGAPSKLQGLMAFGVFLARAILRKGADTNDAKMAEPPLSETFSDAMVSIVER